MDKWAKTDGFSYLKDALHCAKGIGQYHVGAWCGVLAALPSGFFQGDPPLAFSQGVQKHASTVTASRALSLAFPNNACVGGCIRMCMRLYKLCKRAGLIWEENRSLITEFYE